MTLRIRDGFEFYKNAGDPSLRQVGVTYGLWNPNIVGANAVYSDITPFGIGKSLNWNAFGGTFLDAEQSFSSQGTIFFGFWMCTTNGLGGTTPQSSIAIVDNTTTQCTIRMDSGGNMLLYAGSGFGTILATCPGAVVTSSTWEFYCIKIVIHNTNGEFHVRKNWETTDFFAATGLNTRTTANNTANGIQIGNNGGGGYYMDDFAHWDSSGSGNYSDWMTAFRSAALMPNADNSVQFTQTNGGSTTFGTTSTASTQAESANIIALQAFTPTCGGTLGNITLELNANMTGKLNVAIYDSNGDTSVFPTSQKQPGKLIATCTELTNPTSGANTFVPTTTPVIENGKVYFIAVFGNAAFTLKSDNTSLGTGWQYSLAYAAFPSTLAGLGSTLTTKSGTIHATITATNAGMVNDYQQDGTTTYVADSNVNDQDLYAIDPLPAAMTTIQGVDLVIECSKDIIGTRTISPLLKSGGTTVTETAIVVSTTMGYARYQQDVDPNTSAAWTASNLNAALIGQKIAS